MPFRSSEANIAMSPFERSKYAPAGADDPRSPIGEFCYLMVASEFVVGS